MENYWADSPEGAVGKRATTESKINCPGGEDFKREQKRCAGTQIKGYLGRGLRCSCIEDNASYQLAKSLVIFIY